jgi:hypothetical protein
MKSPIVNEPPLEDGDRLRSELLKMNFGYHDCDWILGVLSRPDAFGSSSGKLANDLDTGVGAVVERCTQAPDVQTRLFVLLSYLSGFGPGWMSAKPGEAPVVVEEKPAWVLEYLDNANLRPNEVDWEFLLELHRSRTVSFDLYSATHTAWGPIPLNDLVPLQSVVQAGRTRASHDYADRPDTIVFWLTMEIEKQGACPSLQTYRSALDRVPDSDVGKAVIAVLDATEDSLTLSPLHLDDRNWALAARALVSFLEPLSARIESQDCPPTLIEAWLRLSTTIYGSTHAASAAIPEDLRQSVVTTAREELGRMRRVLRERPEQFKEDPSIYKWSYYALRNFAHPWKTLKLLLMGFAEMRRQAIADDLRFWYDSDREAVPESFSLIPQWIANTIVPPHARWSEEEYLELRMHSAKLFATRLECQESREPESDAQMVEPRPSWRQCYAQAIFELGVDPAKHGGSSLHDTLLWSANNDPDQKVRELSRKTHNHIRNVGPSGIPVESGATGARPLMDAFRWLRRAHLFALGIEVNEEEAKLTRSRELQMTALDPYAS